MNTEKYIVRQTGAERQKLETIVKKLKGTSQKVKRAIVLLKADANGPKWTNEQIHESTGVALKTISNIRKQLVTEGFDVVLDRKNDTYRPFRKTRRIAGSETHRNTLRVTTGSPIVANTAGNGHSGFWPIKRLFWKLSIRSAMKRFDKR